MEGDVGQDWVVLNHDRLNNLTGYLPGMSYSDIMMVKLRKVSGALSCQRPDQRLTLVHAGKGQGLQKAPCSLAEIGGWRPLLVHDAAGAALPGFLPLPKRTQDLRTEIGSLLYKDLTFPLSSPRTFCVRAQSPDRKRSRRCIDEEDRWRG
jgi:hypothetical protein